MQAIVSMAKNHPTIEIAAVMSNQLNSTGIEWAQEQGIATQVVPHKAYADRPSYDHALYQAVQKYQPDYVILAGFMRILTDVFVKPFAGRLVNIHPSLLPSFTGLHTHERALAEGVKIHGCTVHFVTPVLDSGPILAQAMVPVLESDNANTLAARVLRMEHQVYPAVVDYLSRGIVSINEQQKVVFTEPVQTLFTFGKEEG